MPIKAVSFDEFSCTSCISNDSCVILVPRFFICARRSLVICAKKLGYNTQISIFAPKLEQDVEWSLISHGHGWWDYGQKEAVWGWGE